MPPATPSSITLGRFKRLSQRAGEVWQGGIVRLPMWADNPADPEGPPLRASGAIWVSLRTGLLHVELAKDGEEATPELALATLIEFGLKWAKELDGRPARVEVRDPALRDALADQLAVLDISVTVVEDQPAVTAALRSFEEHEAGEQIPGLLEASGMTLERVRAFADAAAFFHGARPWERLTNDDLVVVDAAGAPRDQRHLCVLGQAGVEFGISFFESRRAFERALDQADEGREATRAHGVTFDTIDVMPFADVDLWQDHALAVAGPEAYPFAADLMRDAPVRRPTPRGLSFTEGLLRALAETTEEELDAGAWQKRVETFDGPLELQFSLPFLLEAEKDGPAGSRRGATLTPLEQAQELAYDAMESFGRLRIKQARRALALSEQCADAWVVLAEEAATPEAAAERYERGMQAGADAIGDAFESLRGEFWGHIETQPYMRARLGLAQALIELDRGADAVAHYRAMLELNPEDNQGVRYLLLAELLYQNANDEAGKLLTEYDDDSQALWPYGRLLWTFRTAGSASTATSDALQAAVAANPHALKYLLDPDAMPAEDGPSFELGSREEGAYVADTLLDAFAATDGAIEWLAKQKTRSRRSGPVRGPRVH